MSILLPINTRLATLRAFWAILSVMLGLILTLLTLGSLGVKSIAAGALLAIVMFSLVFVQKRLILPLYRGWNDRLVLPFMNLSRQTVVRLCYFIIFVAVGSAGSRLGLKRSRSSGSFWTPRTSLDFDAYRAAGLDGAMTKPRSGWVRNYVSWAMESGNLWSIALLPFLTVLGWISAPAEEKVASNIYTLF